MHKHWAIAGEFLSTWFCTDETFALLDRLPEQTHTLQRIIRVSDLMESIDFGRLAFENSRGANVFPVIERFRIHHLKEN